MRIFIAFVIPLLWFVAPIFSIAQQQQPQLWDYELKWRNSDFYVDVATGYDEAGEDVAWLVSHLQARETRPLHTRSAEEIIEAFQNQPLATQKKGIRLNSYTFVSLTREKLNMTSFQRDQFNNPAYRKSESELVEKMKSLCEGLGIALFMNTTMDKNKPWCLVTDESTIKDMKDIKPVKRITPIMP